MRRFATASVLTCACLVATTGCEQKQTSPVKQNDPANPPQQDKDAVVAALKKAGINNEPAAIFDDGEFWTVTLTPDGVGADGKMSGPPKLPETAFINKKTQKVEVKGKPRDDNRGGPKPGGGGFLQDQKK